MKSRAAKYIVGIDEVGRGALAGPVVVAAACIPVGLKISNRKLGALKDSKKLSPKLRKLWVEHFKSIPEISYKVARVYPRAIEKINISQAANRGASIASEHLIEFMSAASKQHPYKLEFVRMFEIFLDGGLYIKNQADFNAKTVIKADEKITAVKVASIIAKVQRDRYMEKLSKKYPRYGFGIHKGYGTRSHIRIIRKYGASNKVHRLTFLQKIK